MILMPGIDFGKALALNPDERSIKMGWYPAISAQVVLGEQIPFLAKILWTDTEGGILVVNKNGDNMWLPNVPANTRFDFQFLAILASGNDWQGNARTTVTANFTAYGGE